MWQKALDDKEIRLKNITEADDNSIYISGYNYTKQSQYIFRIDKNGTVITKAAVKVQWGSNGNDLASIDGNAIIGGYTRATEEVVDLDMLVMSVDKELKNQWTKILGHSGKEEIACVDVYDRHIFAAGYTESGEFDGIPAAGGKKDIFISKYNADGSTVWQKRIGGEGNEGVYDMKAASDGGMILLGYTGSKNFAGHEIPGFIEGQAPLFILRLDKDGNINN